jgi:hypothetical protein
MIANLWRAQKSIIFTVARLIMTGRLFHRFTTDKSPEASATRASGAVIVNSSMSGIVPQLIAAVTSSGVALALSAICRFRDLEFRLRPRAAP